jgi:hypothetical protein
MHVLLRRAYAAGWCIHCVGCVRTGARTQAVQLLGLDVLRDVKHRDAHGAWVGESLPRTAAQLHL